jgi:hypothetical protein
MPEPRELLQKRLLSSKTDAALVDKKLAALENQETQTGLLGTLRSVSRMYRETNEVLQEEIGATVAPAKRSRGRKGRPTGG